MFDVEQRKGQIALAALAILTISLNGLPLIPVGFAVSATIIWRSAESFSQARNTLLMALGGLLVGVLVFQVSCDIYSYRDGSEGIGLNVRPFGGITAFNRWQAESELVNRPRWVAYRFEACRRWQGHMVNDNPLQCEEDTIVTIPAHTLFDTSAIDIDPEGYSMTGFVGEIELDGKTEELRLNIDLDDPIPLISEVAPATRAKHIREDFRDAVAAGHAKVGMSGHEVFSALGVPARQRSDQLVYRSGPIVVMGGDPPAATRVVSVETQKTEDEAMRELAGALRDAGIDLNITEWHLVWATDSVRMYTPDLDGRSTPEAELRERALVVLKEAAAAYDGGMKNLMLAFSPNISVSGSVAELRAPAAPVPSKAKSRKGKRKRRR